MAQAMKRRITSNSPHSVLKTDFPEATAVTIELHDPATIPGTWKVERTIGDITHTLLLRPGVHTILAQGLVISYIPDEGTSIAPGEEYDVIAIAASNPGATLTWEEV